MNIDKPSLIPGLNNNNLYILDTLSLFDLYSINKGDKIVVNVKTSNPDNDSNYTQSNLSYYNIINNSITLLFKSPIPNKDTVEKVDDKTSESKLNNKLVKQRYAWKPKLTGGNNSSNILHIIADKSNKLNNKSLYSDYSSSPYIKYHDTDDSEDKNNIKYNNIDFSDSNIYYKYIKCDRGWCSSYNSIYNKYLFTGDKFNVARTNKLPSTFAVSWVNKKYMYNNENAWKSDNSIEDNLNYKNIVSWTFEETNILNRIADHNNIIMKSSIPTKIKTSLKSKTIKHSFKSNQSFFIQNKLHLQSTVIYSDYNYNNITNKDILFTLYPLNTKFDDVQDTISKSDSYNSIVNLYKKNKNISDTLYNISKYNYDNFIKEDYNDINIILTTDSYGTNQYKNTVYEEQNKWYFESDLNVNEGYRIRNKQGVYLFNDETILQIIKQSGNNNDSYLIKNTNTNEYMYTYTIPEVPNLIKIGFSSTKNFNNSFLFNIKSDISKISYPLYNSILRKDFVPGDYIIKSYLYSNKTLISDIYKNKITYDLIDINNSYKLEFVKLSSKLKPIYKLSDRLINFNVIIDYIPFYSNNYNTYVIRNYNNPSEVLTIDNDKNKLVVKWINISKLELLNNNIDTLESSLWSFKLTKKSLSGGKKLTKKNKDKEDTESCSIQ